jgi:hypothetical protein
MKRDGFLGPRRAAAAAALLSVLGVATPTAAHADSWQISAVADSGVCQLTLLSVTLAAPAQAMPNASLALTGTTLTIDGSGTCTGAAGTLPFRVLGSGNTVGAPTCATISSVGAGSFTLGATIPIVYALTGPAAGAQLLIIPSSALQGGAGVAQLSITPASLQACLQPGGTTTIQYTGAVLVAA